jgi:hypothetical protein
VVEDEVVQDDDAGPASERLDDPAVGLGVVADVVEGDVRGRIAAEAALLGGDHVDAPGELGQQEGRVVGDPRTRRRHRAVVRDLHGLGTTP